MAQDCNTTTRGSVPGQTIKVKTIATVLVILLMGLVPAAQADNNARVPPVENFIESLELEDMVAWTTTYPEEMTTGSPFTLSGGFSNKLPVPLLVTLEASAATDDVCSITSYTTQGAGLDLRQHEYLLMPEGWQDGDTVPGVPTNAIPYSYLFNDDTITYSIDYVGNLAGNCRMALTASVQTVGGLGVTLGEQVVTTLIKDPLSTSIDLGGFDIECRTGMVLKNPPLLQQTVSSGSVDLEGTLAWVDRCKNNDWGTMSVEYRKVGRDWKVLEEAVAKISDPGVDTVYDQVDLSEGEYEFRMTGALYGSWLSWGCALAIAAAVGTVGIALVTPDPISKAAVVYLVFQFVVSSGVALHQCQETLDDSDDYTVKVTVEDDPDVMFELPGLPDLPGLPGLPDTPDLPDHD